MRAILQRVLNSKLYVDNKLYSEIGAGLLVFICVCKDDTDKDLEYIAKKIVNMRIFSDKDGKFNLSVKDVNGEIMAVSQFTLAADTKKGNRPSYFYAQEPKKAESMYEKFVETVENMNVAVKHGVFGASMNIELVNNGPVTIFIDSKENDKNRTVDT